jgi:hypothetical protein
MRFSITGKTARKSTEFYTFFQELIKDCPNGLSPPKDRQRGIPAQKVRHLKIPGNSEHRVVGYFL